MSDHAFCFTLFLSCISISYWQPFRCCGGFFNGYRRLVCNLLIFYFCCDILTCNCKQKIMTKTIAKYNRNFVMAFKIMWSNNITEMQFKDTIKHNYAVVLEHLHNVSCVTFHFKRIISVCFIVTLKIQ